MNGHRHAGAPLPADEDLRLATLRAFQILDTDPEALFEDVAALAAAICGTPMAAVSFVDAGRQWFKAEVGLGVRETSRDLAFCAHAILTPDQTMVVPDATADARFAGNALVTGDPRIRFYAGAPMVAGDGSALGSICVIDREPRVLTERQLQALAALSRQVVALLEARSAVAQLQVATAAQARAEAEAEAAQHRLLQVFAAAPVAMVITDHQGFVLEANGAYAALLGVTDGLGGRHVSEFTVPDQDTVAEEWFRALRDGHDRIVREVLHRRGDGSTVLALVTTSVIRDVDGEVVAHLSQVESIAERRAAENLLLEAQSAVDGIIGIDDSGRVVAWNVGAARMFGRDQMIGQELTSVLPERFRAAHRAGLERLRAGGSPRLIGSTVEVAGLRRDGTEFPIELSLSSWHQGGRTCFTAVLRDITERVAAEQRRLAAESRAALLGAAALAVNQASSLDDAIAALLDAVSAATGWQGGHAWLVRDGRLHPTGVWRLDDAERTRALRALTERTVLAPGEGLPGEVLATGRPAHVADGTAGDHPRRRAAAAAGITAGLAVPILAGDELAGVLEYFLPTGSGPPDREWMDVLEQVGAQLGRAVERQRSEAELLRRATRDPLTGLANRTLLLDHLATVLPGGVGGPSATAVLFCDLDRFKVVNDSLGHAAGDVLLSLVGERLAAVLRPGDLLARPGGDEFVVVCEELPGPDAARGVAERLVAALRAPFPLLGQDVVVTASIGVVTTAGAATAEELLRYADLAMYRAKEQGNGGYAVFDEGLRDHIQQRLRTESGLRRALAGDELRVHYQPIVELASGRVTGAEALVRWQPPGQALVPPADFVPLAEDTGLIVPLGDRVLREACRQAAAWARADAGAAPATMSVNVSARQLRHPELVAGIEQALAAAGLPPHRLTLELTESVLAQDADQTVRLLARVKELGVRIAIDDFGTGYSSLAYLRSFPVDVLKIDKRFVDRLGATEADDAIIATVIRLGQALGLDVVAEGVETAEQAALLTALGCSHAQGYHFARPAPAGERGPQLRVAAAGRDGGG
jgi:diguanylate cyclase (GGDEF)-like protein/PAS domain S-box-containing protein